MGPRELLAGGSEQHQAVAFVAVERRQQQRHVLVAGHRELRLQLYAQWLRRRTGGHPFRQGTLCALGGGVDDPLARGAVAVGALGGDQRGPLELLEHRVETLGLDLPSGAEPPVEPIGEVVTVTRVLQQQAEQRAFQR